MEDSLKEYIKQDEASKSAQAAGLNRVDSLLLQLTARGEEVESLRSQLTLAEDTVREMKTSSAKAAAQLESVELRGQTQANRITVLTNQLQARDSVADALKAQLHALEEKQCAPTCFLNHVLHTLRVERKPPPTLRYKALLHPGSHHKLNLNSTADEPDVNCSIRFRMLHLVQHVATLQCVCAPDARAHMLLSEGLVLVAKLIGRP